MADEHLMYTNDISFRIALEQIYKFYRTDLLMSTVLFFSCTGLDAALMGLALTYITSLIDMLQYVARQSAEVENVVSPL